MGNNLMLNKKEREQLDKFAIRIQSISSQLNVGTSHLTPINYITEKEKFFTSESYNPRFVYIKNDSSALRKEIADARSDLSHLVLPSPLTELLINFLDNIENRANLFDSIGTDDFSVCAAENFPYSIPDPKFFYTLQNSLTFNDPVEIQLHNADEIQAIFSEYLHELDISFKISIDTFNDHIVRVGTKGLVIGAAVKRHCHNVQRLIVHEIESHVLQRINLNNSDSPLLRLSNHSESILWGEGMAVFNEIQSGMITRNAYETYYYRLKAVSMLDKSFREIFNYLAQYLTMEKAYMITYRVKRGMGDTSQPGGYPKDAAYLLGYQKVFEYLDSQGEMEFLYMAKNPRIGELLLDYDLVSHHCIHLPKYLRKSVPSITEPTQPPSFSH
jgi:hypothetical protein